MKTFLETEISKSIRNWCGSLDYYINQACSVLLWDLGFCILGRNEMKQIICKNYNHLQKQQITANSSKKFTEINNCNKNQAIPVDM